jgi:hypothetical protein
LENRTVVFRLKIKKLRIVRYNEAGNIHRRRRWQSFVCRLRWQRERRRWRSRVIVIWKMKYFWWNENLNKSFYIYFLAFHSFGGGGVMMDFHLHVHLIRPFYEVFFFNIIMIIVVVIVGIHAPSATTFVWSPLKKNKSIIRRNSQTKTTRIIII